MKIKIPFLLFGFLFLAFFFNSVESWAQSKQRITFKNRVARINGVIGGDQIRQYVFRVRKNQDVDISVENNYLAEIAKPYPKFVVFKPSGEPLYIDQEPANDLLEVLKDSGDYTIRLQLPENMRNNGKPVKFTLQLILK